MPKSKAIGSRKPVFGKPGIDPDDAPELTREFFRQADFYVDGKLMPRRGRPALGDEAKKAVMLRLDPDIVESYRQTGAGWQTRINDDLRKVRKLKKRA